MKKTIVIGLILGVLFSVAGIIGILKCQWNPAHYVNQGEICLASNYIFYPPIFFQSLIFFAKADPNNYIGFNEIGSFIIFGLITIIEFVLISLIVSWAYKKVKGS